MINPAKLIASADEIDNRMGPIPGRSSDRIARELRSAAEGIKALIDTAVEFLEPYEDMESADLFAKFPGEVAQRVVRARDVLARSLALSSHQLGTEK